VMNDQFVLSRAYLAVIMAVALASRLKSSQPELFPVRGFQTLPVLLHLEAERH
jgi:hypothetical protein